jgi:hypothetical protein
MLDEYNSFGGMLWNVFDVVCCSFLVCIWTTRFVILIFNSGFHVIFITQYINDKIHIPDASFFKIRNNKYFKEILIGMNL